MNPKTIAVLILPVLLLGCTGPKAETPTSETPLVEMARKRDGTNYIGVYLGMIAEWSRNNKKWDAEKQCLCGEPMPDSVMMFSATSGQLLRWISYDEFRAVYVLKTKAEYSSSP